MAQRTFRVRILWDPDAKVYYSESDIFGLHIESPSLEEFEEVLMDVAPDLIVANHMSAEDIASKSIRDLLPAILIERPLATVS